MPTVAVAVAAPAVAASPAQDPVTDLSIEGGVLYIGSPWAPPGCTFYDEQLSLKFTWNGGPSTLLIDSLDGYVVGASWSNGVWGSQSQVQLFMQSGRFVASGTYAVEVTYEAGGVVVTQTVPYYFTTEDPPWQGCSP